MTDRGVVAVAQGLVEVMAERVARQYQHALRDLTFNSKPIINNLTMLAQENSAYASSIVQVLIAHLLSVPFAWPVFAYLLV